MEDDDAAARADESEALVAIYGSEVRSSQGGSVIEIDLPGGGAPTTLTLIAHLPATYPSTTPPIVEVRLPLESRHRVAAADAAAAAATAAVAEAYRPGSVVLYEVAEALREREVALSVATAAEEAAREERLAELRKGDGDGVDEDAERGGGGAGPTRRHAVPPPDAADAAFPALAASLGIVSHPPVVVKKSTFQAHVAPVKSPADAKAVVDALLTNKRIAAATHNIMAYRIVQAGSGAVLADCDDDGEAAAGGRLGFMLAAARVEGAVVVVSRWFGGVLLGPSRFGVINNTARDALVAQGFIREASGGGPKKK